MFFYPVVQVITKFGVTWWALRPASWKTDDATIHEDDSNKPYALALDILVECVSPLTGAGYSLIYIYFTPGVTAILWGWLGLSSVGCSGATDRLPHATTTASSAAVSEDKTSLGNNTAASSGNSSSNCNSCDDDAIESAKKQAPSRKVDFSVAAPRLRKS